MIDIENYDNSNIFAKILRKEIHSKKIYEDEFAYAFHDISPQAPTHILIIPKMIIPQLSKSQKQDTETLGHLLWVVTEVARQLNVEDAYRVVINNGAKAGQSVFHLHLHRIHHNHIRLKSKKHRIHFLFRSLSILFFLTLAQTASYLLFPFLVFTFIPLTFTIPIFFLPQLVFSRFLI